jgi:hypothetical protein
MRSVIAEIVNCLGEKALTLSVEDLHLAREEVREAFSHNLGERNFLDMGLAAWEIKRKLLSGINVPSLSH